MKKILSFAVVAMICLGTSSVFAQSYGVTSTSYTPGPNYGSHYYPGYSSGHHRSTELGDALDGYSMVIDAQGRYVRSRSEAIVNLQAAERARLENLLIREQSRLEVEKLRNQLIGVRQERKEILREQAIANKARIVPTPVLSKSGDVIWFDALLVKPFDAQRAKIEQQVLAVRRAKNLSERERAMDALNDSCQILVEMLDQNKANMSVSAVDSCNRFVNRLYDDLQKVETSPATALTSR